MVYIASWATSVDVDACKNDPSYYDSVQAMAGPDAVSATLELTTDWVVHVQQAFWSEHRDAFDSHRFDDLKWQTPGWNEHSGRQLYTAFHNGIECCIVIRRLGLFVGRMRTPLTPDRANALGLVWFSEGRST